MAVDIRNLRCFLAVCSAGSISKAAQVIHIAQPALSMHIKGLEDELGVKLFDRTRRGVRLTPAGTKLEAHAQALIAHFDQAIQEVRRLELTPAGRVTIGLPQSMTKLLTVPLVKETISRWPAVKLQIVELSTGYIPQQVMLGSLDLGITFQSGEQKGLRYVQVANEALVLVAPPGRFAPAKHPTNKLKKVSLAQLQHFPMLLPAKEHGLRVLIDRCLQDNGLEIEPIAEVNVIHQLIDLVSNGVGSTLLSYASVSEEVSQGKLSAAEIRSPSISRPVFLCRSATTAQSMASACVTELLLEIIAKLIADASWPASACEGLGSIA